MAKDYYEILGVSRNVSKDELKKAYRRLAHKYHPDKGGDEKKFRDINEAYSVLSDDRKRTEYDAYGRVFSEGAAAQGFDFNGFAQGSGFDFSQFGNFGTTFENLDLGDIFGEFFGTTQRRVRRGRDISIDLEIQFVDSILGTERKILITKSSLCETCGGKGAQAGSDFVRCGTCNGKGKVHETKRSFIGTFTTTRLCESCFGRGEVPRVKCAACGGVGVLKKQSEIGIRIPSGIEDGEMIKLTGAGEAVPAGQSGDLYIKIHVKPHQVFRKQGSDLVMDLNVKLSSALLGEEYRINALDGEIVVKIPEGASFDEILRVKGKGVPISKGKRGDLLIRLKVELPTKLSKEARKLIEELRKEGI